MSNYFLYICKNKFLLIKTEAAMGYNSQSNIMKKLLLLSIIALTALFTACEKDKPEDYSSTFGLNTSTLDINDPNLYYWKYTTTVICIDEVEGGTGCFSATNKDIIEDFIPYLKEQEVKLSGDFCTTKFSNLSKITKEECDSLDR